MKLTNRIVFHYKMPCFSQNLKLLGIIEMKVKPSFKIRVGIDLCVHQTFTCVCVCILIKLT